MMTDNNREIRVVTPPQRLSLRKTSSGNTIEGQAVVYNALSGDLGGFVERIAPGAFTASLREQDVLALFGHDDSAILGRTSAATLTLRDTQAALEFSCILPDTSVGRDVAVLCARGDLQGMSFGFSVAADEWTQRHDGTILRTVKEAELFEVSVVAFPAYSQSTVSLRTCPAEIARSLRSDPFADDAAREDSLRWRVLTQHRMRNL